MRLAVLAGDEAHGDKSRTFVFQDEGHTLGNALRCIIVRYPEVIFCGYTVPHPAESRMHFRIQTNGPRAVDILRRGLEDLSKYHGCQSQQCSDVNPRTPGVGSSALTMTTSQCAEFVSALHEISHFALTLDSPYDRVRLAEWIRHLNELARQDDHATANQYAQLLRIQVRVGLLRTPFLCPPPRNIPPLTISLGQEIFAHSPSLSSPGPMAPFMCRKSKDGHAYVAARQIPGKGVLCYLAVSTNPIEET